MEYDVNDTTITTYQTDEPDVTMELDVLGQSMT